MGNVFGQTYVDKLLENSDADILAGLQQVVNDQKLDVPVEKIVTFVWITNGKEKNSKLIMKGASTSTCVAAAALSTEGRDECFEETPVLDTKDEPLAKFPTGTCLSRKK